MTTFEMPVRWDGQTGLERLDSNRRTQRGEAATHGARTAESARSEPTVCHARTRRSALRAKAIVAPFAIVLSLAVQSGCATHPAPPSPAQIATIRARAEAQFARAFYLKPAETNVAPAQAHQLAPLLIIETPGPNAPPDWPDANRRPQIFFQAGRAVWNGKPHEQMSYWWSYPKVGGRRHGALPAQGIRITLNSTGRPVIWEVLSDTSGAEVIFVSQNLEAQASREFGSPLPGRRFAVERSLTEAPEDAVARVIEDGPTTMGPIIYLRSDTHDVTTVICRCMDAQARELAGQQEYELVSATKGTAHLPKLREIERSIRLPNDF